MHHMIFKENGGSLRVEIDLAEDRADFWAGVIAGIMSQHTGGGGWEFSYCRRYDDDMGHRWVIQEKHRDGGPRLAGSLVSFAVSCKATMTPEFLAEVESRRPRPRLTPMPIDNCPAGLRFGVAHDRHAACRDCIEAVYRACGAAAPVPVDPATSPHSEDTGRVLLAIRMLRERVIV